MMNQSQKTTTHFKQTSQPACKKNSFRKKLFTWSGIILGGCALLALVYWTGIDNIRKALSAGGPALLLLALLYPVEIFPRAIAWKWVYPTVKKGTYLTFLLGMWVGQSVNRLLPTASIGGDVVRGRLLILKDKKNTNDVVTSLIADKTAHAASTLLLLIFGLIMIMTRITDIKIIAGLIVACLALTAGIIFFIRVQRTSGVSTLLAKWTNEDDGLLSKAEQSAQEIEAKLEQIYAHPKKFIASVLLRVVSNTAMALEIWMAAWLMGAPVSLVEAVTLRIVSFGIRSMAFVIWGGLGIQEGAYALLSTFVGLSPGTLVAISLATRVREVTVAVPGLITWLTTEGLRATQKNKESKNQVPVSQNSS